MCCTRVSHLQNLCEKFPSNEVVRLEKDVAQRTLSQRIVLRVELVETMERIVMRMHIKRVDRQIVRSQVERLEDLGERQGCAITKNNHVIWRPLHFGLDKTEQVFLVHARRMVDVRIDFPDIIKVAGGWYERGKNTGPMLGDNKPMRYSLFMLMSPKGR